MSAAACLSAVHSLLEGMFLSPSLALACSSPVCYALGWVACLLGRTHNACFGSLSADSAGMEEDNSCIACVRRYDALDYTRFDQSLKHCPPEARCRNCMPLNDTADTCWAVKTPVLYRVKSWGKIVTDDQSQQVHLLFLTIHQHDRLPQG